MCLSLAVCVMVKIADHLSSNTHKVFMLVNKMTNLAFFSSFSESCKRHRCPPPQSWKKRNIKFRLCKQVWYSSCLSSWCREDWHGGSLVDLQVSPGPLCSLLPRVVSLEEEGHPHSRMPQRAPRFSTLTSVSHPHWVVSVEVGGSELHFHPFHKPFFIPALFPTNSSKSPNCQGPTFHLQQY